MATLLPGNHRRKRLIEVRKRSPGQANSSGSAFDKSPALKNTAGRQSFAKGSGQQKPGTLIQPSGAASVTSGEESPDSYGSALKSNDAKADFADNMKSDLPQRGDNKNSKPEPSIAEREASAADNKGYSTATDEKEDGFYKDEGRAKAGLRGRFTRRQKIGAGFGIGLIGGGIIFGAVPLLGPLKLLQFGSLLRQTHFFSLEDFGDDRTSRLTTFYRRLYGSTAQATRLGVVSSRYAGRQENRFAERSGLRPVYDKTTGIMRGFQIEDEKKAQRFVNQFETTDGIDIENVSDANRNNLNLGKDGAALGNGRIVSVRGPPDVSANKLAKLRRESIRSVNKAADLNKVSSFVSSRMLIKLGGVDFHPVKNKKRERAQKLVDYYRERAKEHRERIRTGAVDPNAPDLNRQTEVDGEGNPIDDPNTDSALEEARGDIADIDGADADLDSIKKSILSKALRTGATAAAAVSLLCAARDLSNSSSALAFQNTVLIPMRMGFEGMSIAAQILTLQDLNLDEIGYFYNLLYEAASEASRRGRDYTAAATVQGAMGLPPTGIEMNEGVLPGSDNVPEFFKQLSNSTLLSGVCFVESGFGRLVSTLTFGLSDKVANLAGAGIDMVLEGTVGFTMEEALSSAIGWLAGEAVDSLSKGPNRANAMMYGSLYASNMQFLGSGGAEMTTAEAARLERRNSELLRQDLKTASLFERLLSPSNPKSLASYALFSAPASPQQALSSTASLLNPVNMVASGISSLTTKKAFAANTYEYKVSRVGFTVEEQESELIEDPFANAEYVEANFDSLNNEFGGCFPTKLALAGQDDISVSVQSFTDEPVTQFSQDSSCKKETMDATKQERYLRFRIYMYDTVTAKALNCYDGDIEACDELSFNGVSATNSGSGGGSTNLDFEGLTGYAIPCQGDPRPVKRETAGGTIRADWTGLTTSGSIGTGTDGKPINVYIREACPGTASPRTVLIVSSIHGSENGGQLIGHELLYNEDLPDDVRIIVVPELNGYGITYRVTNGGGGRVNGNHVNLNRNSEYRWDTMDGISDNTSPSSTNYRGTAPNSEPEMQAIQSFISSLGNTYVSLHYHDDINYVASAGSAAGVAFAEIYAGVAQMPFGNDGDSGIDVNGNPQVNQRGSLDGWEGSTFTGRPVLLIELDSDQSASVIQRNVNAVKALLDAQ